LAALVPADPALMLGTLRWANEIPSPADLNLPPEGKAAARLKDAELKMAGELIRQMTALFDPARFEDKVLERHPEPCRAQGQSRKGEDDRAVGEGATRS